MVIGGEVVIEAALNGGRDRAENPAVPYTAGELAADARRCGDAGATVFHIHARADDGGWTADPARYAEVMRALREAVPDGLVSITSIRPQRVSVEEILDLLVALAITRLLSECAARSIRPELGVMDLGFVSNAVALRDDGRLPERLWFLIELDSAGFGAGVQVAPSTVANYEALAAAMGEHFPDAHWAVHGQGVAGYAVIERALADGSHIRVGFEDAIHLPDGRLARSNAELVAWAVEAARHVGRTPATAEEARVITGCGSPGGMVAPRG